MSRGPVPKVNRVRDYDGKRRQQEFRVVAADGDVHGPELPAGDWPEQTRALYDTLRRDAIGTTLTSAEWLHVIDTMRLHSLLWRDEASNAIKVAAEVRLRLESLGISPAARMKLRLLVDNDPAGSISALGDLAARRQDGMTPERRKRILAAIEADQSTPAPTTKGNT